MVGIFLELQYNKENDQQQKNLVLLDNDLKIYFLMYEIGMLDLLNRF